jgi:putative heme-binding domain-containing protein
MAFGYEPWMIKTKNGATHFGFLRADGPTVVIRETSGQQQTIPASQIESRTQLTTSLMPDPTVLDLKAQDLANLVEYMLARPRE